MRATRGLAVASLPTLWLDDRGPLRLPIIGPDDRWPWAGAGRDAEARTAADLRPATGAALRLNDVRPVVVGPHRVRNSVCAGANAKVCAAGGLRLSAGIGGRLPC